MEIDTPLRDAFDHFTSGWEWDDSEERESTFSVFLAGACTWDAIVRRTMSEGGGPAEVQHVLALMRAEFNEREEVILATKH